MAKTYIISIGYNHYGTDDKELALNLLGLSALSRDYVDGKHIYTPKEEDIEIKLVDSSCIRPLTKEEVENKELQSALSAASWAKSESANLKKEVEDLKCQLKQVLKIKEEE